MPYRAGSAEVMLGDWCEMVVAQWAIGLGYHVLHTAQIGDGATMVSGPDGKVVMPDLQLFDLMRGRDSRLVEVKAKRGAYPYRKGRVDCTGIDRHRWKDCVRINGSGVPVDLALIHLHWPLRESPEIEPKLLWQTVDALQECGTMEFENRRFPHGASVWDVNAFDLLGDLPNPPAHIIEALHSVECNFRVWERPAEPQRPRIVPGQLELFGDASVYTGRLYRGAQSGEVAGWLCSSGSGLVEFTGLKDPRPGYGYVLTGKAA